MWEIYMTFKLQVKDMKILRELDFHARQPISQIAKKIGLSPEVTAYRIKQLEKKGIITGYYPVIDLAKLGYLFCRYILELERVGPEVEDKLFEFTKNYPSLGWFVLRSNMNVSIVGYVRSLDEAKQILEDLNTQFHTVLKTKKPSFATRIHHFRRNYLYGTKDRDDFITGEGVAVKIDDVDKKILRILCDNAKIPSTEIAEAVGLTAMAVINRIRRLEKEKVLLAYRCALDLEKLGFTHQKVLLYIEQMSHKRKAQLFEYLRSHSPVVYITEVFDEQDLEFEIQLKTFDQLNDFMIELRRQFPEIKKYQSHAFHKEKLVRYIPEGF